MTSSNESVRRWHVPSVHPDPTPEPVRLTVERIEALESEVRDNAWAAGYNEGLNAGKEALRARIETLDTLLSYLADPLKKIEPVVEEALLSLSLSFAEAIVGATLPADEKTLAAVLHEALEALPDPSQETIVYLGPEDFSRFEATMAEQIAGRPWRAEIDPGLTAGDVRVVCGLSEVDGRRRTRIRRLFETVMPGFCGEENKAASLESGADEGGVE